MTVHDITLKLPEGWISETDTFEDEAGSEITRLEASFPNEGGAASFIGIYVGDMPEGETAEDQAFANYAETVGFDEDDPEDFNPIYKLKFNGKNAWGFDAYSEDEMPMRFLSQEVRQGLLAIMYFCASDEDALIELHGYIESHLRIR